MFTSCLFSCFSYWVNDKFNHECKKGEIQVWLEGQTTMMIISLGFIIIIMKDTWTPFIVKIWVNESSLGSHVTYHVSFSHLWPVSLLESLVSGVTSVINPQHVFWQCFIYVSFEQKQRKVFERSERIPMLK